MRSADFQGECPSDPSEQNCGIAAARWLVQNELIYIDTEPIDATTKAFEATLDETPGVFWDNTATGDALNLVDQAAVGETSSFFASATFDCKGCSKWVKVSLEPFNSFGIDVVEP